MAVLALTLGPLFIYRGVHYFPPLGYFFGFHIRLAAQTILGSALIAVGGKSANTPWAQISTSNIPNFFCSVPRDILVPSPRLLHESQVQDPLLVGNNRGHH